MNKKNLYIKPKVKTKKILPKLYRNKFNLQLSDSHLLADVTKDYY
jgi:hypothetical protein